MKQDENTKVLYLLGSVPVIWSALLIAPSINDGLIEIISTFTVKIEAPFNIEFCENSLKTVLIFLAVYFMSVGAYLSCKRNYRKGEEHGSAKWGKIREINKKYKQFPENQNKILTQNVSLGINGKKHRRNLNVLVCGGSGAGKTRFYCKPNISQANTSFVILDPKGEILRDTGYMLEKKGYEVKVLDLINMEKSHCYNPFVYIRSDNDVQKLVTSLFKSTTPKGSSGSQDPFWGATCCSLKRTA